MFYLRGAAHASPRQPRPVYACCIKPVCESRPGSNQPRKVAVGLKVRQRLVLPSFISAERKEPANMPFNNTLATAHAQGESAESEEHPLILLRTDSVDLMKSP